MADWFKVDDAEDDVRGLRAEPEVDSETDPDSDYEELRFNEETDEWTLPDNLPIAEKIIENPVSPSQLYERPIFYILSS